MDFYAVLDQAVDLLRQRGRVTYRALKIQFKLDDDQLEALKDEILYAHPQVADDAGRGLLWSDAPAVAPPPAVAPAPAEDRAPLTYTPSHLAEKILTSRAALEGERKQVTVLFADLKGSTELLAERDPEEARQLLDPVLDRLMAAVHQYEGTVNQVMGDGIMALFGAPLAHEDHAVRACYAALHIQEAVKQYAAEVQRSHGVPLHIRVGLNAGEVVARSIGSDLHMDYTAVGQTTHLAARMEQMAMPGSILITPAVLGLVEGFVQVKTLGAMPVRGLRDPVEVHEVTGAGVVRPRLQAAEGRGVAEEAVRIAEAAEQPFSIAAAHWCAGFVSRRQGRLQRANPALERSLALCQSVNFPRLFPIAASILAAAYALAGRAVEALPLLDQVRERVATGNRVIFQVLVLTGLSEALLLVGRVEEASALARRLLDLSRTHIGRGYQAHACRLLGEVARRREPPDADQAATHYRQALALDEEIGMRPLQAHCHLGLGTLNAKTGQREQAHAELSAAIDLYRAMDMTFWLPQAEAALVQVEGSR